MVPRKSASKPVAGRPPNLLVKFNLHGFTTSGSGMWSTALEKNKEIYCKPCQHEECSEDDQASVPGDGRSPPGDRRSEDIQKNLLWQTHDVARKGQMLRHSRTQPQVPTGSVVPLTQARHNQLYGIVVHSRITSLRNLEERRLGARDRGTLLPNWGHSASGVSPNKKESGIWARDE